MSETRGEVRIGKRVAVETGLLELAMSDVRQF